MMRAALACLAALLLVSGAAATYPSYKIKLTSGWIDPNVGQLRPIPCAAGMRPAGRGDTALLDAFLEEQFYAAMADTRSAAGIKRKAPAEYCANGVNPASVHFYDLSGCIEKAAAPSWAQAQGVVSYTCVGAPHTPLELGVEADGQFFALRRK